MYGGVGAGSGEWEGAGIGRMDERDLCLMTYVIRVVWQIFNVVFNNFIVGLFYAISI